MNRKGKVYFKNDFAGVIEENDDGFLFTYDVDYLRQPECKPISLTMPLEAKAYNSKTMLPFFDGLIPEGWLLDIAEKNWKIDPRDRMSLLLAFCKDCIGAVSVIPVEKHDGE
ncbi:MAG: HipA N-terminal domain-containing protein [Bacteroidetes bacterium]|nr:HipA N-terminal domain-containing protein [Bacteroidota bacterium]